MMRDINESTFWVKVDLDIDAWMLATDRKQDVFDIDAFVKQAPNIIPDLQRLRKTLNVRVITDRCPVTVAVSKRTNPEADKAKNDSPQLSSQSYWTTFKSWWR